MKSHPINKEGSREMMSKNLPLTEAPKGKFLSTQKSPQHEEAGKSVSECIPRPYFY